MTRMDLGEEIPKKGFEGAEAASWNNFFSYSL